MGRENAACELVPSTEQQRGTVSTQPEFIKSRVHATYAFCVVERESPCNLPSLVQISLGDVEGVLGLSQVIRPALTGPRRLGVCGLAIAMSTRRTLRNTVSKTRGRHTARFTWSPSKSLEFKSLELTVVGPFAGGFSFVFDI